MPTARRIEKFARVAALRDLSAAVVLEDIHDPHNAAASFRSCDAFGVQNVHLVFGQEKPFNPKREGRKTSGYASKWLDFHIHHGAQEAIRALKESGHTLIATKVDPTAQALHALDLAAVEKPAFIFGNEHRGISEDMAKGADRLVCLPMLGLAESFNLSVAVALTLAEYFSQKRLGRPPAPRAPCAAAAAEAPAPDPAQRALLEKWLGKMRP